MSVLSGVQKGKACLDHSSVRRRVVLLCVACIHCEMSLVKILRNVIGDDYESCVPPILVELRSLVARIDHDGHALFVLKRFSDTLPSFDRDLLFTNEHDNFMELALLKFFKITSRAFKTASQDSDAPDKKQLQVVCRLCMQVLFENQLQTVSGSLSVVWFFYLLNTDQAFERQVFAVCGLACREWNSFSDTGRSEIVELSVRNLFTEGGTNSWPLDFVAMHALDVFTCLADMENHRAELFAGLLHWCAVLNYKDKLRELEERNGMDALPLALQPFNRLSSELLSVVAEDQRGAFMFFCVDILQTLVAADADLKGCDAWSVALLENAQNTAATFGVLLEPFNSLPMTLFEICGESGYPVAVAFDSEQYAVLDVNMPKMFTCCKNCQSVLHRFTDWSTLGMSAWCGHTFCSAECFRKFEISHKRVKAVCDDVKFEFAMDFDTYLSNHVQSNMAKLNEGRHASTTFTCDMIIKLMQASTASEGEDCTVLCSDILFKFFRSSWDKLDNTIERYQVINYSNVLRMMDKIVTSGSFTCGFFTALVAIFMLFRAVENCNFSMETLFDDKFALQYAKLMVTPDTAAGHFSAAQEARDKIEKTLTSGKRVQRMVHKTHLKKLQNLRLASASDHDVYEYVFIDSMRMFRIMIDEMVPGLFLSQLFVYNKLDLQKTYTTLEDVRFDTTNVYNYVAKLSRHLFGDRQLLTMEQNFTHESFPEANVGDHLSRKANRRLESSPFYISFSDGKHYRFLPQCHILNLIINLLFILSSPGIDIHFNAIFQAQMKQRFAVIGRSFILFRLNSYLKWSSIMCKMMRRVRCGSKAALRLTYGSVDMASHFCAWKKAVTHRHVFRYLEVGKSRLVKSVFESWKQRAWCTRAKVAAVHSMNLRNTVTNVFSSWVQSVHASKMMEDLADGHLHLVRTRHLKIVVSAWLQVTVMQAILSEHKGRLADCHLRGLIFRKWRESAFHGVIMLAKKEMDARALYGKTVLRMFRSRCLFMSSIRAMFNKWKAKAKDNLQTMNLFLDSIDCPAEQEDCSNSIYRVLKDSTNLRVSKLNANAQEFVRGASKKSKTNLPAVVLPPPIPTARRRRSELPKPKPTGPFALMPWVCFGQDFWTQVESSG